MNISLPALGIKTHCVTCHYRTGILIGAKANAAGEADFIAKRLRPARLPNARQ